MTGVPGWLGNRFLEILTYRGELLPARIEIPDSKVKCLYLPGIEPAFFKSLSDQVEFVPGDISDIDSLDNFFENAEGGTLFHLAGVIHPAKGVKQFYEVNVKGTQNLLVKAQQYKFRKVVIISSSSPCGGNPSSEHRFTEDSPFNPYMHYGKSKMLTERAVQRFQENFDLDITILRGCWFFGPHQPSRQTKFFSMIKNGKFPLVGSGKNKRSLTYIDDLCQAMLLCLVTRKSKNKTYWIATEKAYSMLEIIATVENILKKDFGFTISCRQLQLPKFIGTLARGIDYTLQHLGFYSSEFHVLSEMDQTIACSINLAKEELGYKPSVDLRGGMRMSVQWCLEQGCNI